MDRNPKIISTLAMSVERAMQHSQAILITVMICGSQMTIKRSEHLVDESGMHGLKWEV